LQPCLEVLSPYTVVAIVSPGGRAGVSHDVAYSSPKMSSI